jgi:uncharacterized protein YcfJ
MMKKVLYLLVFAAISNLMAEVVTFTKKVPVYKSVEVQRVIERRVPYEECWDEEVIEEDNSDVVGAIIGGAAGGILGHQIGGGSGKDVATVGGAIIGTLVGKNLAENNSQDRVRVVKRCRTRYKIEEDRIVEYKNYAKIMGREVVKYSTKPLRYIRADITVKY